MTRSQNARSWPQLEPILDWYFEEMVNPTIQTLVRQLEDGREMPPSYGDSPKMQKLAKIGRALSWLPKAQRDGIRVCWIFKRQFQWWTSHAKNLGRAARKTLRTLPEYAVLHTKKTEIRVLATHYRQERRRVEKKPAVQKGLSKLDEYRRNGWETPRVGLGSEE